MYWPSENDNIIYIDNNHVFRKKVFSSYRNWKIWSTYSRTFAYVNKWIFWTRIRFFCTKVFFLPPIKITLAGIYQYEKAQSNKCGISLLYYFMFKTKCSNIFIIWALLEHFVYTITFFKWELHFLSPIGTELMI